MGRPLRVAQVEPRRRRVPQPMGTTLPEDESLTSVLPSTQSLMRLTGEDPAPRAGGHDLPQ